MLDYLNDFVKQMFALRIELVIILCLNLLGFFLKQFSFFPNKYIPAILLVLGMTVYMLVGNPGAVENTIRHPSLVLAMWGFLLGAMAVFLHEKVLRYLEKIIPGMKVQDTVVIQSPASNPADVAVVVTPPTPTAGSPAPETTIKVDTHDK